MQQYRGLLLSNDTAKLMLRKITGDEKSSPLGPWVQDKMITVEALGISIPKNTLSLANNMTVNIFRDIYKLRYSW